MCIFRGTDNCATFHGSLTHINIHTSGPGQKHSRGLGQRCSLDFFLSQWPACSCTLCSSDPEHLLEMIWSLRGHAAAIMPLVTWRAQKKQGYLKERRVEFRPGPPPSTSLRATDSCNKFCRWSRKRSLIFVFKK